MGNQETTKPKRIREYRTTNRTTMITTSKANFDYIKSLKEGTLVDVDFCNDIVSTSRGGRDIDHHEVRRVNLLRRQLNCGFDKIKLRYRMNETIPCRLVKIQDIFNEDSCACRVIVEKLGAVA